MRQIITSSPIKSNPSTEMLDILLDASAKLASDGLISGTIVVFDGFVYAEREEWKQSRINQTSIDNYKQFKINIKQRFGREVDHQTKKQQTGANSYSSLEITFYEDNVIVIEHSARVGFALALFSGLELVKTPLVLVNQHDWVLTPNVPFQNIVDTMTLNPTMNYVGFVSRRSTKYHLKHNLQAFEMNNLPFCKLYFWYDRIHLARTDFYKTQVFNKNRFQRGYFIEDTFGHEMLRDCEIGNWENYNAYFYYPDEGMTVCCTHLNGRSYISKNDRENLKNRHEFVS